MIFKRMLGDESFINEVMMFDKIHIQGEKEIKKYLEECLNLSWRSITNNKEHGIVKMKFGKGLDQNVIKKSQKEIKMEFFINDENILEGEPLIIKNEILLVKYSIVSLDNKLSHKIYLESIEFKETNIGFVIDGKTTIRCGEN